MRYRIAKETQAEYDRAFKKIRQRLKVERLSYKHQQAIITLAYRWSTIQFSKGKFVSIENAMIAVAKTYPRDQMYSLLSKEFVWQADQWIPKWHIDSVNELVKQMKGV